MDQGLLQGLAEGLRSGISSYREESDRKYKKEFEQKKYAKEAEESAERLGLLKEQREFEKMKIGMKKDQDGNWVKDPESDYLKEKARKGLLEDVQLQQAKAGLLKTGMETQKLQSEINNPGGTKAPSADQFKAAGFAKRLEQAESVFGDLGAQGYDRSSIKQGLLSAIPGAAGAAKPENLRKQEQAERNFVNSVLRRESGAAVSPSEFSSAEMQYFDRPGDTPEIKAQKKANRMQVYESLKAESGGAYSRIPTVSVPRSTQPQNNMDQAAAQWAQANPNDPRAAEIKKRLGL